MYKLVIVEYFGDISKRRDCVAHLSVHDGVHCNASGEWSFSKLGIVKGELRSSMRQERLSMSTEHELLSSLDFTDTIEEFALAKARKTAIGPISKQHQRSSKSDNINMPR